MTKLIAGSDVSGDEIRGQHRHIAFIIGKEEDINAQYNKIGFREIHMLRLEEWQRTYIIQNIDFEKYNIKAWCFNVNKQNTVNLIYNDTKLHPKNKRKEQVYKNFDLHLLEHFKSDLENIAFPNELTLSDIRVQCDSDMSSTVRNWNMKSDSKGKAYELSDAIAWCNERGKELKGCYECNLEQELYDKTSYALFK